MFGTYVEKDLDDASNKAKKPKQAESAQMRVLQKWLGHDVVGFRTPTATRKV